MSQLENNITRSKTPKGIFGVAVLLTAFFVFLSSTYVVTHDHDAHEHEVTQECVLCSGISFAGFKPEPPENTLTQIDQQNTPLPHYDGFVVPSVKQVDPLTARAPPTSLLFS